MDSSLSSSELTPEQLQAYRLQMESYFWRHVVCLAVQYVALDDNGQPSGKEHFLAISGFMMSFRGLWFLVTAGHVLNDLDNRLKRRELRITSCRLADYFGIDAKIKEPLPFTYDEDTIRGFIDNDQIGLDLGLIFIRDFFRLSLEANGVKAIVEEDWSSIDSISFDAFVLLGFPAELVRRATPSVEQGRSITATVPMTAIGVEYIEDVSTIPDTVPLAESELPYFYGRLIPTDVPKIEGMSGGPIVGMKQTPQGIRYWIVALQSAWYERSRIIKACPVQIFGIIIDELFKQRGVPSDISKQLSIDGDQQR